MPQAPKDGVPSGMAAGCSANCKCTSAQSAISGKSFIPLSVLFIQGTFLDKTKIL